MGERKTQYKIPSWASKRASSQSASVSRPILPSGLASAVSSRGENSSPLWKRQAAGSTRNTNAWKARAKSTRQKILARHIHRHMSTSKLTRSSWTSGRGSLGSPLPDHPRVPRQRTPRIRTVSFRPRCWRCHLPLAVAWCAICAYTFGFMFRLPSDTGHDDRRGSRLVFHRRLFDVIRACHACVLSLGLKHLSTKALPFVV